MARWSSVLGVLLLAVPAAVSAGAALLGASAGTTVDALLEPLCPEGTEIEHPEDGEPVAEDVGTARDYAVCDSSESNYTQLVEAFVVASDPDRAILNTADGWESGDGTGVTWAVKEDGEDWIAVIAVGDEFDQDAFEELADEGFALHSNPSSPLEGYDDYYD